MRISPERADRYSEWAREFYNPNLAYHNWEHAEEVMRESHALINMRGGRWTRNVNRQLLQIAAAWHDAGYDDEEQAQHETPEHYAVHLMRQRLKGELANRQLASIEESILGTRFRAPRENMAAVALHYGDVSNMAATYDNFLNHSRALWKEHGSPEWYAWRDGALGVLAIIADEATRELPYIGVDGLDFAARIHKNAARLQREETPER